MAEDQLPKRWAIGSEAQKIYDAARRGDTGTAAEANEVIRQWGFNRKKVSLTMDGEGNYIIAEVERSVMKRVLLHTSDLNAVAEWFIEHGFFVDYSKPERVT